MNFLLTTVLRRRGTNALHTINASRNQVLFPSNQVVRFMPMCTFLSSTINLQPFQQRRIITKLCGENVLLSSNTVVSTSVHNMAWNSKSYFHKNSVNNEKSLPLVHVLKEISKSPAPALVFGVSGLISFVFVPCYFLSGGVFLSNIAFAQLAYGASILSFLGGVRWGFTLPGAVRHELTWKNLGLSVIPTLIAWSALNMPYSAGTLMVMAGIGGAAYADLMYNSYPTWFKALRFCLSLVAVLSLWSSFVLSFTLEHGV